MSQAKNKHLAKAEMSGEMASTSLRWPHFSTRACPAAAFVRCSHLAQYVHGEDSLSCHKWTYVTGEGGTTLHYSTLNGHDCSPLPLHISTWYMHRVWDRALTEFKLRDRERTQLTPGFLTARLRNETFRPESRVEERVTCNQDQQNLIESLTSRSAQHVGSFQRGGNSGV